MSDDRIQPLIGVSSSTCGGSIDRAWGPTLARLGAGRLDETSSLKVVERPVHEGATHRNRHRQSLVLGDLGSDTEPVAWFFHDQRQDDLVDQGKVV